MNCPSCSHPNPAGAKFCLNCGTRLEVRPPEGERRFVTVLFADVVDSTAMGERIDPEQVAEIMNGAFAFFNAAVSRYGGTVARLMGDAVLALFGAPVAHEDDPERAIRAGLEIVESARAYGRAVNQTYGVEFRVRVGINSGLAVLAMVGDEVKMEYTAMGDTANVAARMQSSASPGTVLISADTYNLVRHLFDVEPREPIEVKGKSLPIATYVVRAALSDRGKMRGLEGLTSELVGREAEFALIQRAVERVAGGEGSAIAIVGEAGLGKSRLIAEVRAWAGDQPQPVRWLEGRALSYGQPVAYYPWRQIIRQAIGVSDLDAPEVVTEHLQSVVIDEDVPFLERMLAIDSDQSSQMLADMSGNQFVTRLTAAVQRFVAAQTPAVVVFDDMHWADEPSLDLITSIARAVESESLLVIFILRPDRQARSWETRRQLQTDLADKFAETELQALSGDDAQLLLRNLLDIREFPAAVRDLILTKSDGNPFYLEEVIRSLIDSGHIVHDERGWRATSGILDVAIPDTLAGILASRIDRLPEETKRVVQTAAVIGRIFPYPVLTAAIQAAPAHERIENPKPHVDTLTDEELVRERLRDPELEYIFKHALTQEAAYDLLLIRRRREYHLRVAEVLERLHGQQLDDLAPMLAHHFWVAEDWEKAAAYFKRAAVGAVKLNAQHEAVADYDRAYRALKRLPDPPAEALIDIIVSWMEVGVKGYGYQESLERLEEAERLARPLGDPGRLAAVLVWIGNLHALNGFPSRGGPALMEGYRLAEEVGDERLMVVPLFAMTSSMVDRDPHGAIPRLDEVIALARKNHRREIEAHTVAIKGMAYARLGEFRRAAETVRIAEKLIEDLDVAITIADVHSVLALTSFDMGQIDRGMEYSRMAADEAAAISFGECNLYARYCTGLGHVRKGEFEDARGIFKEAMPEAQAIRSDLVQYFLGSALNMVDTLSGDQEAMAQGEQVRANARALGDEYTAAALSLAEAEARLHAGQLPEADRALADALAYYRRAGMQPYLARGLGVLADIRARQDRGEEAEQARDEAQQLTRELNAALAGIQPAGAV